MNTKSIPIEDDPCDVIAKAMRGLGINREELSKLSGIDSNTIQSLLEGQPIPATLAKIAAPLNLSANALVSLDTYYPETSPPDGLHTITSAFGHAGVNSFVIKHNHQTATLIDTGTDAESILQFLATNQIKLSRILITHEHPDHVMGLHELRNIPVVFPGNINHGDTITTETGEIKVIDASGHCNPSRAYFFEGLSKPICAVGDSIFAGSIGGTRHPNHYTTALETADKNIMTLPPETILCPGHGPLTTVAQEQQNNPFLNKS